MPRAIACLKCGHEHFTRTTLYMLESANGIRAKKERIEYHCAKCRAIFDPHQLSKSWMDVWIVADLKEKLAVAYKYAQNQEVYFIVANQNEALYLKATLGNTVNYTTSRYYKDEINHIRASHVVFGTEFIEPLSFYNPDQNYVVVITEKELYKTVASEHQLEHLFGEGFQVKVSKGVT